MLEVMRGKSDGSMHLSMRDMPSQAMKCEFACAYHHHVRSSIFPMGQNVWSDLLDVKDT